MEIASPTPAHAHLTERQRLRPPAYPLNSIGADRARALCGVLSGGLPQPLQDFLRDGVLTVGEIGSYKPDIRTFALASRNFVIEVNSGLMDFYYAVGRAIAGTFVVYSTSDIRHPTSDKPDNRQALQVADVSALIAQTFTQWRTYSRPTLWDRLSQEQRIQHASFPIADAVRAPTEMLVTSAELFMLAHELGHVAIDGKIRPPTHDSEERSADALGLEFYLPAAEAVVGRRTTYAGAAFAIRVTGGLARAGVKFSRTYPTPAERLGDLRAALRNACPSQQYFDEVATIMVAYLDLMDDVDDRINARTASQFGDAWQTRVRLIAMLEEIAKGRSTQNVFVANWVGDPGKLPPEAMADIAATLIRYYVGPPTAESYVHEPLRAKMGEALMACVSLIPEPLTAAFRV